MESKKYNNLNKGGKTNSQANFSIPFSSTTKFVNEKLQTVCEYLMLEFQRFSFHYTVWSLVIQKGKHPKEVYSNVENTCSLSFDLVI